MHYRFAPLGREGAYGILKHLKEVSKPAECLRVLSPLCSRAALNAAGARISISGCDRQQTLVGKHLPDSLASATRANWDRPGIACRV